MTAVSPPRSALSRLATLVGVVLITVSLLTMPTAESSAAAAPGIEVSDLPGPFEAIDDLYIGAADAESRRLYVFAKNALTQQFSAVEYDLSTAVPKQLRVSPPGITKAGILSPYRVIIDRSRQRMLIINTRDSGNTSKIDVIDLKTLTLEQSWDVSRIAPGFLTTGFTYDKRTDRLYLAGDFTATTNTGSVNRTAGAKPLTQGSAVVALEAKDGSFLWASPMPQCDSVLDSSTAGALIAKSQYRPALYVFCIGGTTGYQPSGQNGLVRMDIAAEETARGVASFPNEFFPISGNYVESANKTGIAAFDPGSERFFAQSLASRTPGTWVFDGLRDSWVGFVAAPDNDNLYYGLNIRNGRHYMGGRPEAGGGQIPGYVNVTDGRSTPLAQGTLFEDIYIRGQIIADPQTNRLFAPSMVPIGEKDGLPQYRLGVMMLRDNTEPIRPLDALDLDQLTKDLPDDKALLQFSAGASGFGARYVAIGGWESAWSRIITPLFPNIPNPAGENPADLAYGDRGTTFAAVPAVDIRPAGASATAAGGALDQATQSDRKDAESQTGAPTAPVTSLSDGLTCLDGGQKRVEHQRGNGDPERVHVTCDLRKLSAQGTASFSDEINGGSQSLGSSSFTSRTFRDPKRGVVTETTAVARGISLRNPGGAGAISIDRVTAVATTVANGRPGTTKATWERTVEGVVISDGGAEQKPSSCTTTFTAGAKEQSEGDCARLQRALNGVSSRLKVRFPSPTVTATPRGAFARIEERDSDYLNSLTTNNDQSRAVPAMEAVIYNDGPEKGRLLVQMAAIDANSIFTRSGLFAPLPTGTTTKVGPNVGGEVVRGETAGGAAGSPEPSGAAGPSAASGGAGVTGTSGSASLGGDESDLGLGGDGSDLAPSVAGGAEGGLAAPGATGLPGQPVMGWLIGARAPREAALATGTWLLFAGALSSVWRRRRLIETVGN